MLGKLGRKPREGRISSEQGEGGKKGVRYMKEGFRQRLLLLIHFPATQM